MGRKKRQEKVDHTTRGRKLGPRRRIDISEVDDADHRESLVQFANSIKVLAALQLHNGSVPDDLLQEAAGKFFMREEEIKEKIDHFNAYQNKFPNEHPANAFTPLHRSAQDLDSDDPVGADKPPQGLKPIRRHPHISSVSDPALRQKYIDEAWEYHRLNEEESRLGRLAPGSLIQAARKLGITRDWVTKQRKHLYAYHEEYPQDPLGTSVVPLPRGPAQQGRLNGGKTNPEAKALRAQIIQDVEDAYMNQKWYSRDGDANHSTETYSLNEKDVFLGPRLIYELVKKKYGDIVDESTVWRIIDDFRARHPTRVRAAYNGIDDIRQNVHPHLSNDVSGPGARGQIDIRPLPKRVQLEGMIDTTVYVAWFLDDFSRALLEHETIPRKVVGPENKIELQDFECKQIRILIARFIQRTGRRPRIIYVDRGPQFREALQKFMSFLTAPGESPTEIIYRKGARGGGKVERNLQMIDEFLSASRGYVREKNFRRSYQQTKTNKLKTYETFKQDFATFRFHWNYDLDSKGGPSRWQIWEGGPDKSLSAPPLINLILFASGERHETRTWDGGGFAIDSGKWIPAEPSPELYEKLDDAKLRRDEIPVIIGTIGDVKCVFFRFPREIEWYQAILESESRASRRKHNSILNSLDWEIVKSNEKRAADFFERTILADPAKPLVLDALSRKRSFIQPGDKLPYAQYPAPQHEDDNNSEPLLNKAGEQSSDEKTESVATLPGGDVVSTDVVAEEQPPSQEVTDPAPEKASERDNAGTNPETAPPLEAQSANDSDDHADSDSEALPEQPKRKFGFISKRLAKK